MLAWLLAGVLSAGPATSPAGDDALITLDVRELDVKVAVGLLTEAAGRQGVVDADVACRLTLKLSRVAWRVALQSALRACRLGVEEQGRILRIATLARLMEEGQERRALAEEQVRSKRAEWTQVRLSYARAAELAPVLGRLLPAGGEVTFDARTNTLYVRSP